MQLVIGTVRFAVNGTLLASSVHTKFNDGGQPLALLRRLQVQGYLLTAYSGASAQTDLTLQMNTLATVLAPGIVGDVVFYTDAGLPSGTGLLNAGSITGVRCVEGPNYPRSQGPEYATERFYTFTLEGEYPLPGTAGLLLSWTETLTFSGGAPIYVHRLALNGPPQKQLVYPASIFKATQQGEAVGYAAYPTAPAAKWPSALMAGPGTFSRRSPKRLGRGYQEYPLSWHYEFESASPLVGLPTVWLR